MAAVINDRVWESCISRLIQHHDLYKHVIVKGEAFEELLVQSLQENGCEPIWTYGSHESGVDIVVNGIRISAKSGKSRRKGHFSYLGGRTTTHKTLNEKIKALSDNEDIIIIISGQRNKDLSAIDYSLRVVDSSKLDLYSLDWTETSGAWVGVGDFNAKIVKGLSDQLWLEFTESLITARFDCTIQLESYITLEDFF